MNIDFPFHFDGRGRTAEADYARHIRNLIEQLLFTNPGERVNRPDFGSGLLQMVFAPNSTAMAATLQVTAQAALQQWLGDVIEILSFEVSVEESTLRVELEYLIKLTQERSAATLERNLARSA
jgi:Bacteriophage baseplate protein W